MKNAPTVTLAPALDALSSGSRRRDTWRPSDVEHFFREHVKTIRARTTYAHDAPAAARRFAPLFDGFELRNYVGPVEEIEVLFDRFEVSMVAYLLVPARDKREVIATNGQWSASYETLADYDAPRIVREMVRRALAEAHQHELDECLHLRGDRIFDPHLRAGR